MSLDPISYSLVKRSRKAVIPSPREITEKSQFWYDEYTNNLKTYHFNKSRWAIIKKNIGYERFDNNLENGIWTNYINIPISTAPSTSIQYKIEIAGDNINVYSNDGTTVLATGTGGLDFWGKVQINGKDIRVFDETYGQNYFWIELFDITNQKCIIWTKINAGQTQLNIAYGNSDCLSSNYHGGGMTFEFFDDFEDGVIDTNKWQYPTSLDIVESGGYLRIAPTVDNEQTVLSIQTFSSGILELKAKYDYGVSNALYTGFSPLNYDRLGDITTDAFGLNDSEYYSSGGYWINGVITEFFTPLANTWRKYITGFDGAGNVFFEVDGTRATDTFSPANPVYVHISDKKIGEYTYVDYIFVRKYIADLTFGTPTIQQF